MGTSDAAGAIATAGKVVSVTKIGKASGGKPLHHWHLRTRKKFDKAAIPGAVLAGKNLGGKQFCGADLRSAVLVRANLRRSDFSGADLSDAKLTGADCGGTSFDRATLVGADFIDVKLHDPHDGHASFVDADLSGAKLRNVRIGLVNFARANLTKADLSKSNLALARLQSATLDGAVFQHSEPTDTSRTHPGRGSTTTTVSSKNWELMDLTGARLHGCDLSGMHFDAMNASNASFTGARLVGTTFAHAFLSNACFDEADLTDTHFAECFYRLYSDDAGSAVIGAHTVAGASDVGEDPSVVSFQGAVLRRTRFGFADGTAWIPATFDFSGAHIEDVTFSNWDTGSHTLRFARSNLTRVAIENIRSGRPGSTSTCDFSHANLSGIRLSGDLGTSLSFVGAQLQNVDARSLRVAGSAYFDGARIVPESTTVTFADSTIDEDVSVAGCSLAGVSLSGCRIGGVLSGAEADLSGADFTDTDVKEMNLRSVRARNTKFDRASIGGTVQGDSETDLTGASFRSVTIDGALRFAGTRADRCAFDGIDLLSDAAFTDTDLTAASFQRAHFQGADFSGATLRQATFRSADFSGVARFRNADLRGADFRYATFVDAVDFSGADLSGVDLTETEFSGRVTYEGATFNGSELPPPKARH